MDGKKIGAVVVIVLVIIGIFAFNSYEQDKLTKENNAKELKEKQLAQSQKLTSLKEAQEQLLQKKEEELRVLEAQKQDEKEQALVLEKIKDEKIAKLNAFKNTRHTFNFDSNAVVLNDTQELKDFLAGVDLLAEANLLNKIEIDAYADNVGSNSYNLKLSSKRAESLNDKLQKYKVELQTNGKGETNPLASNTTKEGRALNRRIEIEIK